MTLAARAANSGTSFLIISICRSAVIQEVEPINYGIIYPIEIIFIISKSCLMTVDTSKHMKTRKWIRPIRRLVLILFAFIVLTQDYWQPPLDNWRCARLAEEISERYGLVVRYGDPMDFAVQPEKPLLNDPKEGFFIGRADIQYVKNALSGVRSALSKYPPALIQKYLKAVFIAGIIKTYGTEIGASYFNSWIYLSALEQYEPDGNELYELNLHHELSSLFLNGADFPFKKWKLVNAPDFEYLTETIDVVRAAALESRQDPENAYLWLQAGFVHDYGMSSMNNDFNMYAELAMSNPESLRQLAEQYPRIKAKTEILVQFYSSLAPELGAYFKKAGLIDSGAR